MTSIYKLYDQNVQITLHKLLTLPFAERPDLMKQSFKLRLCLMLFLQPKNIAFLTKNSSYFSQNLQ